MDLVSEINVYILLLLIIQSNKIRQNRLVHNTSIIRNNSPRSKNCEQQLSRASHNSLIVFPT